MSQFPLEVLANILSRLPDKSLARFRCVSKSWLSLINSYEFLKLRLSGSIQTNTSLSLIIRHRHRRLYLIDFNSRDDIVLTSNVKYDSRLESDNEFMIRGSANGLLCLSDQSDEISFYPFTDQLALWNPLTGKCHKLPLPSTTLRPTGDQSHLVQAFGFGYDAINDDFKVVMIVLIENFHISFYPAHEVKVYSLESNSWHKVKCIPHGNYLDRKNGVLVSGALHWASNTSRSYGKLLHIVAFDLSSESYRLVPMPECSDKDSSDLRMLGGCLSVICYNSGESAHIWVLEEYGVESSWTKFVLWRDPEPAYIIYYHAIAYSKDGTQVLVYGAYNSILWFDLKEKKFRRICVDGMHGLDTIEALGHVVQGVETTAAANQHALIAEDQSRRDVNVEGEQSAPVAEAEPHVSGEGVEQLASAAEGQSSEEAIGNQVAIGEPHDATGNSVEDHPPAASASQLQVISGSRDFDGLSLPSDKVAVLVGILQLHPSCLSSLHLRSPSHRCSAYDLLAQAILDLKELKGSSSSISYLNLFCLLDDLEVYGFQMGWLRKEVLQLQQNAEYRLKVLADKEAKHKVREELLKQLQALDVELAADDPPEDSLDCLSAMFPSL